MSLAPAAAAGDAAAERAALVDCLHSALAALDQDQLLSLLANLDQQRAIGRIGDSDADALEARMTRLLSGRHLTKRRKLVADKEPAQDGAGDKA